MVKWEGTLEYSDNKKHVSGEKTCKEVSNYIIWNERENIKICALFMSIL